MRFKAGIIRNRFNNPVVNFPFFEYEHTDCDCHILSIGYFYFSFLSKECYSNQYDT